MNTVTFVDRTTGKTIEENPPGEALMKFMYGKNPLGALSLHLLIKRKFISSAGGWYMNTKRSAARVVPFVKQHKMSMDDYIVPPNGFDSFNDFFYRKLKKNSRPIGAGLVSPADGKILVFDPIQQQQSFFVKGSSFNLQAFLGDKQLAQKYEGGSMAIIRLAPVDYHRFHFSAAGTIGASKLIKGHYYSVSPIALQQNLKIFCQNKRAYSILKTDNFGDLLFCEVGATMVGSILQTYTENSRVQKGDEKGYFAFGGSTTVLLCEKGHVQFSEDLLSNTQKGLETAIKMGETIGNQLM